MNTLNNINSILLAALKPSQYRNYWKEWNTNFRGRYDKIFGTDEKGKPRYRIYLPIENISSEDLCNYNTLPSYMRNLINIIVSIKAQTIGFYHDFLPNILKFKYNHAELGNQYNLYIPNFLSIYVRIKDADDLYKATNDFKLDYDKYIKPFLASFCVNINDIDNYELLEKEASILLTNGYLENNKGQQIKIIKFLEKLKYLFSKCTNADNNLIHEINECLDKGIEDYNKFSMELVDKKKKNQEYEIVISRHPYDVAGMSTDRGWTSCMELPNKNKPRGGQFYRYVEADIEYGTLVCYFIKKEDHNIEHPMGRVLIKPYLKEMPLIEIADIFDDYFVPKYKDNLNEIYNNIINIYNDIFNLFNNQEKYIKLDNTDLKVSIRYSQIMFEFKNSKTKKSVHIYLDMLTSLYNELHEIYQIKRNAQRDPNDKTYSKLKYLQKFKDILALISKVYNDISYLQELFSKKIIETKEESSNNKLLVIEKAKYGIFPDKVKDILNDWLENVVNKGISGTFIKDKNLYDDGSPEQISKE